ncbi:MAG: hypothetical protein ABI741_15960, partial [Ferruginibacter sp.]
MSLLSFSSWWSDLQLDFAVKIIIRMPGLLFKINEALRLILSADKGLSQNKTGQLFKNVELPDCVESIGVEPTTSCMPCKRS